VLHSENRLFLQLMLTREHAYRQVEGGGLWIKLADRAINERALGRPSAIVTICSKIARSRSGPRAFRPAEMLVAVLVELIDR
jgi:hypothetical protein